MDIYALYRKIPGGMLLIPMFLMAIINTLFPNLLNSLGGMSQALFKSGTLCLAAFLLFASGTALEVKSLGKVLRKSGGLAIAKLVISFGFGIAFLKLFGLDGVANINAVAFITCICSCNPGVYMGLIQDFGEPSDMGNFALLNILTMPAIPILVLAAASGGSFNWLELITILIPFFLGILLGNLDPRLAKMFTAATPLALPFLGCCFGSSINLLSAAKAGVAGIILSLIYMAIHILIMLPTDRLILKQPGYSSMAMSSVAGIAIAVPAMLGDTYSAYAATATAQIALCMILTSIMSPIITRAVVKKWGAPCAFKKDAAPIPAQPAPQK